MSGQVSDLTHADPPPSGQTRRDSPSGTSREEWASPGSGPLSDVTITRASTVGSSTALTQRDHISGQLHTIAMAYLGDAPNRMPDQASSSPSHQSFTYPASSVPPAVYHATMYMCPPSQGRAWRTEF